MMSHHDDNNVPLVAGVVGIAVIAAAAGAITALMLAPKSGREMRRDLRRGAEDARRMAEERFNDVRHKAEEGFDHIRHRSNEVAEEAEKQTRGFWGRS